MTIQKLINYCLNTPENINPSILEPMIRELMEKGEGSAKVYGKNYATLNEAITAASANAEIILSDDIVEPETIRLNKSLTINLNGKTIKSNSGIPFILKDNVSLTIKGKEGEPAIEGTVAVAGNNTNLIIEGGIYEQPNTEYAVIQTNGSFSSSNVTIKNAKIIGYDSAVYLPANGKYVFDNCEISGGSGMYIKGGETEINDCTITAKGAFAEPIPNGNGANSTGDGIILDSKRGYSGNMKLIISGNTTIKSENGYAIHEALTDLTSSATVALTIEDGKFSGKKSAFKVSEAFDAGVAENKINCEIAGGVYSSLIDEKYLAEGKECISSGIKFIVK